MALMTASSRLALSATTNVASVAAAVPRQRGREESEVTMASWSAVLSANACLPPSASSSPSSSFGSISSSQSSRRVQRRAGRCRVAGSSSISHGKSRRRGDLTVITSKQQQHNEQDHHKPQPSQQFQRQSSLSAPPSLAPPSNHTSKQSDQQLPPFTSSLSPTLLLSLLASHAPLLASPSTSIAAELAVSPSPPSSFLGSVLSSPSLLEPATSASSSLLSSLSSLSYLLASSLPLTGLSSAESVAPPGSDDFNAGFASAFLLVLFSEIGDKTFFIAAILATRRPIPEVFAGTFGALAVMTVVSVAFGRVFHFVDEAFPVVFGSTAVPLDDVAAAILLVYFGLSTLRDAASMDDSKAEEEQEEAEKAVATVATSGAASTSVAIAASVFALVFLAEWGDKSFFSTIALAAASSPLGVVSGAVAAHGFATVIAVLGGSVLAQYISEKAIAYIGGSLFLVFAGATILNIIDG